MRGLWKGVRIEVHPLFLCLMVLIGLGRGWVELLLFLLCLGMHELGHLLVLGGQEEQIAEVRLLPFGAVIRPRAWVLDPRVEMATAVAGPLHNLALVGMAWLGRDLVPDPDMAAYFLEVNATLGLFNLLPFLPLDGGRMLRAYWSLRLGWRRANTRLAGWSRWGGVGLTVGGLGLLACGHYLPSWFVLAWAVFQAGAEEVEAGMYSFLRQMSRKYQRFRQSGHLPSAPLVASPDARVLDLLRCFQPHRYHLVAVLHEGRNLGWVTEEELLRAVEHRPGVLVGEILKRE